MACIITNRGLRVLADTAISSSTDFRTGVIKGAVPSTATIRDLNTVADLLAEASVAEAAASGYSRQDLAGVTNPTESDASDNVTVTATAPTLTSVAVGETWLAAFHYIEGANDAARTLIAVDTPAASLVTNGGNVTLPQLSLTWTNP